MEECFKCYVSETRALLFDAISLKGIVKICGKCSAKVNIPIINHISPPKIEKQPTMYERLSKISGVNPDKRDSFKIEEKDGLRDLVNANYSFKENLELKENLVHNFHWIIMRARRMKHMTQKQFAQEIHESEMAIKKIEEGFAPEKVDVLKKIERFLGIRIRKHIESEKLSENQENKLEEKKDLDIKNLDDLTISDLYEMKKKKEDEFFKKMADEGKFEEV